MSRIEGPSGPGRPDAPKPKGPKPTGPSFDEVMKKQSLGGSGSPRAGASAYPDASRSETTRGRDAATGDTSLDEEKKSDEAKDGAVERPSGEVDEDTARNESDTRREADRGNTDRGPAERATSEPIRPQATTEAGRAGGASRLSPEVYHRVVEAARLVSHQSGATELQLALRAPGHEGTRLHLESRDGAVRVTFLVERLAQKEAVEAELVQLRLRLEGQGVNVSEVRVELQSSRDASAQGDGRGDRGGAQDQSKQGRDPGGAHESSSTATSRGDESAKDQDKTDYTL